MGPGLTYASLPDRQHPGPARHFWFVRLKTLGLCRGTREVVGTAGEGGSDTPEFERLQVEAAVAAKPLAHLRTGIDPDPRPEHKTIDLPAGPGRRHRIGHGGSVRTGAVVVGSSGADEHAATVRILRWRRQHGRCRACIRMLFAGSVSRGVLTITQFPSWGSETIR